VREQAYLLLRDAIVDCSLRPGQRIVEDNLANTYGVSRTPLREALHKLEQEGLLERLPRRGLAVSELSIKELTELYEVRSTLEGLAAKLTTQRQTPEQARIFRTYMEKTLVCQCNGEEQAMLKMLREFHQNVVRWCGNAVCLDFLNKMDTKIKRYVYIGMLHKDRQKVATQEHFEILRHVLDRDADGAERAIRSHIYNGLACCDAYITTMYVKSADGSSG
jgi:DNA-binding GntR family transcriptional regulator